MKSLKADIFSSSSGSDLLALAVAFDLLAVLVEQHAGAVEHGLLGEDRHLDAHGQRERVARARVDLQRRAVVVEHDARVEGVVREVVDEDVVHVARPASRSWSAAGRA